MNPIFTTGEEATKFTLRTGKAVATVSECVPQSVLGTHQYTNREYSQVRQVSNFFHLGAAVEEMAKDQGVFRQKSNFKRLEDVRNYIWVLA